MNTSSYWFVHKTFSFYFTFESISFSLSILSCKVFRIHQLSSLHACIHVISQSPLSFTCTNISTAWCKLLFNIPFYLNSSFLSKSLSTHHDLFEIECNRQFWIFFSDDGIVYVVLKIYYIIYYYVYCYSIIMIVVELISLK